MFSSFRIRSVERDRETDRKRFDRLSQATSKLADEIKKELEGLERRYSETRTSAAFAQAAFENEGDPEISSKARDLTASMMRCASRIDSLQKQIAFISDLEKSVASFSAKNVIEGQGD